MPYYKYKKIVELKTKETRTAKNAWNTVTKKRGRRYFYRRTQKALGRRRRLEFLGQAGTFIMNRGAITLSTVLLVGMLSTESLNQSSWRLHPWLVAIGVTQCASKAGKKVTRAFEFGVVFKNASPRNK